MIFYCQKKKEILEKKWRGLCPPGPPSIVGPGMNKNFDSLKSMLHNLNFSFKIICITETWCQGSENNSNYGIPGYTSIHQPRAVSQISNHAGGGVCVFIHNSLNFKSRSELSINNADCESLKGLRTEKMAFLNFLNFSRF